VEEQIPTLPHQLLGGRIVVDGDGDVLVAVDIGEHAGHGGGQAGQEDVLCVGPVRWRAAARRCPW
jgi:hypothetical protein